ncbi:ATP synthase F1 subunit delta [Aegicerativicinus sediminis]|uniref:ATP synthase F1 subunit delta n=1 Tax=Aegicerativicinus sediminis TaxID=2893202 RepID=UPI001E48A7C8|nr:ATP synthase F1 subunit delta [Aegicerativicinus sediminis]
MAGERAAIRYAKATLSLAVDKGIEGKINEDMLQINSLIKENSELRAVLESPIIRSSDKKAILTKIVSGETELTHNLINVLIENKRINLLGAVSSSFVALYNSLKDKEIAKVTTAVPLTKELEDKVLAKVKELTAKNVELKNIVDPEILGGFILRVGDQQYNASIANQLNKLKKEFSIN